MRFLLLFPAAGLLGACGPQLEGEVIAGRTVMVSNGGDEPLGIIRIIANDATGRSECVDTPGTVLAPGRSYTTTFFLCDEVKEVDVETDQGWRELDLQ